MKTRPKTRRLSSRAVCAIVGLALLVEASLAVAQSAGQHVAPDPNQSSATLQPRPVSTPTTTPTWEVTAETYAFVFGLGLVGYGLFFRRQVKQRF